MLSPRDLAFMRATQTAHMMDECDLQTCTQTIDSFGQMVETFSDGSAQACGLDMRTGAERRGAQNTVLQYDASIRLAITANPSAKDRVKVTKRFGESLTTALVYEIVGPVQRGPSGIRLLLKRIEV